jgi:hypothetical protein
MGERKVINKYFPPDFDHTKIPRMRTGKGQQHKIRMMVPMSIRCNRCGNYIYKGTKFNARKETVTGEVRGLEQLSVVAFALPAPKSVVPKKIRVPFLFAQFGAI